MKKFLKIPKHWKWISLTEDLNYIPTGVSVYDGKKKYYSTGSIKSSKEYIPEGEYTHDERPSRANRIVQKNDVVQARMKGTNKALLIGDDLDDTLFSTGFFQVRPFEETYDSKLLYYVFSSSVFLKVKDGLCSGSTQSALNDTNAKKIELPLPPLDEQKRIVAKIDTLLSELDRSIESLKRAKEKLKRYRQAVLKAAFEGKLTEEWRKQHAHELEDAQTLLERIKQERQTAYEAKLAEWEAEVKAWEEGGKVGKKPTKPKKPKELPPLSEEELDALPKLPEGWEWIRMDAAGEIQLGRQRSPKHHHGKFMRPYLRVANVFENRIDVTDLLEMNFTPKEFKIYKLEYGDILLNEGQSLELVGRPAMFRNEIKDACFQNTLIRFRPFESILNEYALYLFLNYFHSQVFQKIASWTTSIAHLGVGRFSNLIFPICSNKEQKEIVSRIRRLFDEAEIMDKTIEISLKKAESLRQSILKSAFEGRLVSHKPANTSLFNSPSQPLNIEGISPTDLHAGIIALSYKMHQEGRCLDKLNHVKHEKVAHMVESVVGIDLGRAPVQDAAGPADFNHLKKVEHRAQKANWFTIENEEVGYRYKPLPGFDRCIARTKEALGEHLETVERLIKLMLPMSMDSAEIFATTYAAWNNMLMDGLTPTDEEIVSKAREEWSARKLTFERERFFKALEWMREKGIVPRGTGKYVRQKKK